MSKMTDSLEAWIQEFVSGSKWIDKIPSKKTKTDYLKNLDKYCNFVHLNPDELINLKIQGLQNINTDKEFIAEDTLENFLTKSKYPLSVKGSIRSTVISFYKANRRTLTEVKTVDVPESKKRQPKIEDILEMENAMTCDRDKALVWFFASSPVRDGSIPKLVWDDLKPTNDAEVPYQFLIESTRLKGSGIGKYKGLKHVGFLHSLAVQKLEAYKKELAHKGYIINPKSPIFIAYRKEQKITPLQAVTIEHIFDRASFKAWHDLEVKRFSPQDFREFFQSTFEKKANENLIAPMMTHKAKGTAKSYSDHNISELLEKFKECLPYLLPITVQSVKSELNETEKELTETKKAYEDLETKFVEQLAEKQKETMKAVLKMLKSQGIKAEWEEEGEEP